MRARTPNVLIQFITKQATPHGRKHPARDPNQEPHIVTLIKTRTTKQGKFYINTTKEILDKCCHNSPNLFVYFQFKHNLTPTSQLKTPNTNGPS
jgi:hypothetical protein